MNKEKQQLTKKIQSLKKRDCLTKKELEIMYRTPYYLEKLMIESHLPITEIKEKVVGSKENWHVTYRNAYWKLDVKQLNILSNLLNISINDLLEIIEQDIKIQKK